MYDINENESTLLLRERMPWWTYVLALGVILPSMLVYGWFAVRAGAEQPWFQMVCGVMFVLVGGAACLKILCLRRITRFDFELGEGCQKRFFCSILFSIRRFRVQSIEGLSVERRPNPWGVADELANHVFFVALEGRSRLLIANLLSPKDAKALADLLSAELELTIEWQ